MPKLSRKTLRGVSQKPLSKAKPGGVDIGAPGSPKPKGDRSADEVPRGGGSIKGYEGQWSR